MGNKNNQNGTGGFGFNFNPPESPKPKTREQFLTDLVSEVNSTKHSVEKLQTKYGIDRQKFDQKINMLTEEEIKKLYVSSLQFISINKFETWIRNNLENLKSEPDEPEKPDLTALRKQIMAEIRSSLNQKPNVKYFLDANFRNWETKIFEFHEKIALIDYQKKILAHIEKVWSRLIEENLKEENGQKATMEDNKRYLNFIEKSEGELAYEQNKEEIKKLKIAVATDNLTEYLQKFLAGLPAKLAKYEVEENELDSPTWREIQQLKNGAITEPERLVETEMKIIRKIGEKGAEKKITDFTSRVKQVLKTRNKEQIQELKEALTEFINSLNIYFQVHKTQAENLLKQLEENIRSHDTSNPPHNFPWKIVVPSGLFGTLITATAIVIAKKKKKNS